MLILMLPMMVGVRVVRVDPGFEVVFKRDGGQIDTGKVRWLDQRR